MTFEEFLKDIMDTIVFHYEGVIDENDFGVYWCDEKDIRNEAKESAENVMMELKFLENRVNEIIRENRKKQREERRSKNEYLRKNAEDWY